MSSRPEHRRRERSWERDDRDRDRGGHSRGGRGGGSKSYRDEGRRRSSRSRSPRRGGDRDRRGGDRREPHRRDREDEWRDRDRDRDRDRREERGGRRGDDDRDGKRRSPRREDGKDGSRRSRDEEDARNRTPQPSMATMPKVISDFPGAKALVTQSRPNLDPDAPDELDGEGEAMDAENGDDAAMMAMMGLTGFGTTKGKPVEGNQEGGVEVKKQRTWRQYMNRRGGFNRPLDKIK